MKARIFKDGDKWVFLEAHGPFDSPRYWMCDEWVGLISYIEHLSRKFRTWGSQWKP